ncbi:hypothetical protein [Dyadobacter sandarakinus]|uniref:Lipid-binding hydrolase n=1 Tax=Dyadobacter sandarakinus TaxID=2747268 RepID=A0ABX7I688_9BACT|nr:hypothetical protein [Dyadobacter sandarakinus]QRR01002.1 hypothetical protein HWI92_08860 [Dyadobacter sandarakinus]
MKKLIFFCLVIFMGACKHDDEAVTPEFDFAPEFTGNYWTTTIDGPTTINHDWVVTPLVKNQLGIVYTKVVKVTAAGTVLTLNQKYTLVNVVPSTADTFTINETVDVEQDNGVLLRQKVEGVATKIVNGSGIPQINITLKLTNTASNASTEEYLEFKKK